jgi:hypothetical protein
LVFARAFPSAAQCQPWGPGAEDDLETDTFAFNVSDGNKPFTRRKLSAISSTHWELSHQW